MSRLESGDRLSFLARLGGGLVEPAPVNHAHPLPGPLPGGVPPVVSTQLDGADPVGSFCRSAEALGCTIQRVGDQAGVPGALEAVVRRHECRTAVVSEQPEALAAAAALRHLGLATQAASKEACAAADLGLAFADAAIATTGSVIQRSDTIGGRTVSLLPPVFCCVVPVGRIVPTLAEALASLTADSMPSNVVIVTGPSRSGDIENIIVRGVHGPVAVELIVVES